LMILDPGMHHRQSSQCLLQKHTLYCVYKVLAQRPHSVPSEKAYC
jgi:hypothetical protein